jgi:hypothetical protein
MEQATWKTIDNIKVDLTDVECEVGSISSGQGPKVDF